MVQGKMTLTDDEILEEFRKRDDPVLSVPECSEIWDMSQTGARGRLNDLVGEGYLKKKNPTGQMAVYWLSEDSEES